MAKNYKFLNNKILIIPILGILFLSFTIFDHQILAESDSQTLVAKTDGTNSFRPQVTVGENVLYLVWTEESYENHEIYFSKSSDAGSSFDSYINLSHNIGVSAFPRMAVSENNVYAIWYDYTPGSSDIFLAKSNDTGKTFETFNLSKNLGPSYNPWISVMDEKVFVVWNDGTRDVIDQFGEEKAKEIIIESADISFGKQDILFASSNDAGDNFEIFSISDPNVESWNPRMIVHEEKVYVVWNGRSNDITDIFFSASNDGGISFSPPVNVSQSKNQSMDAGLAVWEENLYIIWKEADSNGNYILFSKTADDGLNFISPINIGKNLKAAMARDTQISSFEDNVYVVWYENAKDGDVYFAKSKDGGESFEEPISIDLGHGTSEFPQIATYQDQVYVIWSNHSAENSDVFFRASFDGGSTFGSIKNISKDENDSLLFILGPQIAVTEQGVFTVFENKSQHGDGDLILDKFTPNITPKGNLILHLENNSNTNIEINFDSTEIKVEESISFSLRFFDSMSGKNLSDVNYSIIIKDSEDQTLIEKSSQYAQDGEDTQTVEFLKTGPVNVLIVIEGTGTEMPFDESNSGGTGFIITVVPGFDYGMMLILAVVIIASLFAVGYALKFSKKSANQ
ncbi:MAG: glycoside hydrolase [Nitrosopumilus sp.]|nr:glycoside hydrolase [Nitrosopumilus sp.]